MFAIIDDFTAMGFQKGYRITDHRQVFLRRTAQDFTDMQSRSFSIDRYDRGIDLEQAAHLSILGGTHTLPTRRAKSCQLGMLKLDFLGSGEEFDVPRIGSGPASLDIIHAKALELSGNAQLVIDREMDPLPLRAVAEGGIVDFDGACHGSVGGRLGKGRGPFRVPRNGESPVGRSVQRAQSPMMVIIEGRMARPSAKRREVEECAKGAMT